MDVVDIIIAKRDGHRLSDQQIEWFISNYAQGETIADEQAAALAMAIYFQGMEPDELSVWTRAMINSGASLQLGDLGRPTVDKHSTGGVGDKVSLILVPLVAACGAAVPQLSGRGLGHTGGTLDKMEAISGWRASLSLEEMVTQLREVGGIIAGATSDLNPVDRRLYALRDVTGTVSSIPLIASSIMSKKIAEGTGALVLDVKVGAGAFLPEVERGRQVAEAMVALGEDHGVRTVALLTDMETVLGRAAGNALEVTESLEILAGGGPSDVIEITVALAREMLALVDIDIDPAEVLASGAALEVFEQMVSAQGGDLSAGLPVAEHQQQVVAQESGYLSRLDCRSVGVAAWRLGAGRARKEDPVSPTAGVMCLAKPGDKVEAGQPLLELHSDDADRFDPALAALEGALSISENAPAVRPLIVDRIAKEG
ncbi:MAG TPA: thymidine phosphorylase [Acidimicrobiia bacterium]|jgi:thymidine phosphorylase|nr:thymidine phosphorylase [Acidimicrobiia bacterium]HIL46655.1 thymidine phosphorylase [Acidimicrobiia bacterium]